jgi:hypothetical protein
MTKLLTNNTERFKTTLYESIPLKERELGNGALFEFSGNISASRNNLFLSEMQQRIVISNPDRPPNVTKFHAALPKSSLAVRQDKNATIVFSAELYGGSERFVLYRYNDGKLGHVIIPTHYGVHQRLGFKLKKTRKDFRPGTKLMQGEILADTPSNLGGVYGFGVVLNVCLGSFADVAEDGYVISDAAVERLGYVTNESIEFSVKRDEILLPISGSDDVRKTLPEVGDRLRPDNVVAVVRKLDKDIAVAQLTPKSLQEIRMTDKAYTFKDAFDGVVTSVKVIRGSKERLVTDNKHLDSVAEHYIKYYRSITQAYYSACGGIGKLYGNQSTLQDKQAFSNITAELSAYLTRIFGVLDIDDKIKTNRNRFGVTSLTKKSEKFGSYLVTITIAKNRRPDMASKFADRAGSKGVLSSKIWKAEDMPVDENGIRADLLGSGVSTLNRNNAGRLMEHYFNGIGSKAGHVVADLLGLHRGGGVLGKRIPSSTRNRVNKTRAHLENLYYDNNELFNQAVDYVIDALAHYDPDSAEVVHGHRDFEVIIDYLTEIVILNRLTTSYSATSMANKAMERIIGVEREGIHQYSPTPVTYRNPVGELITTKEAIRIAPTYMMLLERDSSEFSATDTCYLQSQNFTATTTKDDKQKESISSTNVSNLGLDEATIVGSSIPPHVMAEFKDCLGNPSTIAHVTDLILGSEDCTNIKGIDRKEHPFGGTTSQRVVSHTMATWGLEMTFTPYDYKLDL